MKKKDKKKGGKEVVLNWIKSRSSVFPKETDYESSPTTVYVRRNIKEMQEKNDDGSTVIFYEYEEAKLTHEEYSIYAAEKTMEDNASIKQVLADMLERLK